MVLDLLQKRTNAHYEGFCRALLQAKRNDVVRSLLINDSKQTDFIYLIFAVLVKTRTNKNVNHNH